MVHAYVSHSTQGSRGMGVPLLFPSRWRLFSHKACSRFGILRLAVILGLWMAVLAHPNKAQLSAEKVTDARLQGFQGRDQLPKGADPSSLARIMDRAQQGSMEAQYTAGLLKLYGANGVRPDEKESYRWFSMAAAQNHVPSMTNLGLMSYRGMGTEANYQTAGRWFERGADLGDSDAQWMLGRLYFDGLIGRRTQASQPEFQKAAYWFDKSAEAGNNEGAFNAGIMYEYGLGVRQNYARAFELYSKAAAQGHIQAKYYSGVMMLFGRGMKQDFKKAAVQIRESAQHGFAPAMLQLAKLHSHGQGVERDYRLAEVWFGKAAAAAQDDGLRVEASRLQKELHRLIKEADEKMLQDAKRAVAM